jgi:hypothetical protein
MIKKVKSILFPTLLFIVLSGSTPAASDPFTIFCSSYGNWCLAKPCNHYFTSDFLRIGSTLKSKKSGLYFGLQAGVCISTFTGDMKNTKMKTGFSGGLVGIYNSDQVIGGQFEINYVQMGTKTEFTDIQTILGFTTTTEQEYTFDNRCITIPLMVKGLFGSKTKFSLDAGLFLAFLTSARQSGSSTVTVSMGTSIDTTYTTKFDDDVKELFNGSDYGPAFGAGTIIPLSKRRGPSPTLFFNARYYMGITKIMKKTVSSSVFSSENIKNSFFEIKAGIAIPIH